MLNFKDKNFWRMTLALALPIAFQNLLTSSFTLVDTIMIGQLGDIALSSVGMAGQVSWFLNMVLFGLCSGGAMFISQYWGAKDMKGIKRTTGIAVGMSFVVTIVFTLVSIIFAEQIIYIFNKDENVIKVGTEYLKIVAWSYPAIGLNLSLCAALRAVEKVKIPVMVSFVTTITNIFLDYCLIFGKFGFPALGVAGGALATVIAAWTAPVVIFISSFVSKNYLWDKPANFFEFSPSFLKLFFKKATPVIFNEMMWGLCMVIFNIIYSNIGYEEYAAVTISRTIENVVFIFFIGLGNACSVMVGKSIGCGDFKRAKMDATRFTVLVPIVGLVLGGLVIIFRESLITLFNMSGNISDVTYNTTMGLLLVYGIVIPFRNIPYIQICGIFRSGGDTAIGVKYDLCSSWSLSLPATIIAAYVLKLPFVAVMAVMYVFDDWPKIFLCLRHFLSGKWVKPITDQGKMHAGIE